MLRIPCTRTARQGSILSFALVSLLLLSSCQHIPFLGKKAVETPVIPPMPAWATAGGAQQGVANVTYGDTPPGSDDGTFNGMQGTPSSATGGMFDFSSVVQTSAQGSSNLGWQRSASEATLQSRVKGKPLLILAAHKLSSPSQALENTLTPLPDFAAIAQEFVLLRLDYSDKEVADSPYYKDFKKRLKIRGYPTLLVLLPDGTEILRLSGYKTEYQSRYLTQLKGSLKGVEDAVTQRRERLKTQEGYRLWKTPDGTDFFAKPVEIDANTIVFQTEWNESLKTFMSRLSPEDQAWIEEKRQAAKPSS